MNANNWPELPIILEENKTITIPNMPMCYVTAPARILKKILKTKLKINNRKPSDLRSS